jgi:hypothetical protein
VQVENEDLKVRLKRVEQEVRSLRDVLDPRGRSQEPGAKTDLQGRK